MNVWDKLRAGAYHNDVEYPASPYKPKLAANPTAAQARAYADAMEWHTTVHEPKYEKLREAYYARAREIESEFRADLEAYYGMKGHPKADLLYSKSYERAHSGGFEEMAKAYDDYVELVK
jgi:hypothetical protein